MDQSVAKSDDHPFQSLVFIPLALSPPTDNADTVPAQWFEREILRSLGFVLDLEADHLFPTKGIEYSFRRSRVEYTQFVHRSGAAFCQILPNAEGFLFEKNRTLMANPSYWRSQGAVSADEIKSKLTDFCKDPDRLEKFFLEKRKEVSDL